MQIMIDIPDKVYGLLKYFEKAIGFADKEEDDDDVKTALIRAVVNGTPLPKGHGKLKDADKIANDVNALKDNWNRYGNEYESGRYESYDYAVDTIDDASTIIEADKTESEIQ